MNLTKYEKDLRRWMLQTSDLVMHQFALSCAQHAIYDDRILDSFLFPQAEQLLLTKQQWLLTPRSFSQQLHDMQWALHLEVEQTQGLPQALYLASSAVFWAAEQQRFVQWFSTHIQLSFWKCSQAVCLLAGRRHSTPYKEELARQQQVLIELRDAHRRAASDDSILHSQHAWEEALFS